MIAPGKLIILAACALSVADLAWTQSSRRDTSPAPVGPATAVAPATQPAFVLTSPAVKDGGELPKEFPVEVGRDTLLAAMKDLILAQGELRVVYTRSPADAGVAPPRPEPWRKRAGTWPSPRIPTFRLTWPFEDAEGVRYG